MKESLEDKILTDISRPEDYAGVGSKKLSEGTEKLLSVEVKNEVLWVNENMELPFNIEEGQSNRLGMFLTPDSRSHLYDSSYHLEMVPRHRRSGILGRVIFKDKDGRLYRDVDLKGVGYSRGYDSVYVSRPEIGEDPSYPDGTKSLGILDRAYAENDIKMAEKFLKAGIRTYRPIALIKLEEIIDGGGNKIPLEEAKKRKMIKEDDEPVVEVRAFGTRARIADLSGIDSRRRDILIEDAVRLAAQERGIDFKAFSKRDYLVWFIENLAVSVARMHDKNWIHGYLTTHNITLDARIVDLDSVETLAEISKRRRAGEDTHKSFDDDGVEVFNVIDELKEIGRAHV
jgi:hypothetical protein